MACTKITLRKLLHLRATTILNTTSILNNMITQVVISTLRVNGTVISDSISKVDVLNQCFKSVLLLKKPTTFQFSLISSYPAISNIEITVTGMYNLLTNCNFHKPPCSDNVHNNLLRETAADIALLLTHLFQQSLRTGTLPNDWKKSYSHLQKGERSDPKNYWPVSLTSAAA